MSQSVPRLVSVLLLLSSCFVFAQSPPSETPAANPGRPTVSTPATLTPTGYLQLENGVFYASGSPEFSNQWSINQVTKLTLTSRFQLLLLSQPLTRTANPGGTDSRAGGGSAGVQAVVLPGKRRRPTVSVSYIHRLYNSGAADIDIGSFSQSALLLISADIAGFHVDTNGVASEQTQGALRRPQFGQTLSISHPVGKFTVAGELWHFSQPLTKGNAVGNLWAASYSIKGNLVIDAGFNHGFTSTSTHWEEFTGFTYVLPQRLWKAQD